MPLIKKNKKKQSNKKLAKYNFKKKIYLYHLFMKILLKKNTVIV